MISKRIIPMFLLKGSRLVKGVRFNDFIDVGDPVSQGMIYDAQGADEIIIVDVDASREGRTIDPEITNSMIKKCRLPIAAGGGIKSLNDAHKCFSSGADKIIINSSAVVNPGLIRQLADEFGSQSVLVSIDVRRDGDENYEVYIFSGTKKAGISLDQAIEDAENNGAGEIMITSIDREGTLSGFEYDLYEEYAKRVSVPLIASGGAGCYDDMVELFERTKSDACAIGRMLFLRDYDIVRIKAYLKGRKTEVREA